MDETFVRRMDYLRVHGVPTVPRRARSLAPTNRNGVSYSTAFDSQKGGRPSAALPAREHPWPFELPDASVRLRAED